MRSFSWAILPAAQVLFDKSKVTVAEIAKEWGSGTVPYPHSKWGYGTVVVCEKENGSLQFIGSCAGDVGYTIGQSHRAHHDQTGRDMGYLKVVNVVSYKTVNGKVEYTSLVDFKQDTKAVFAVFK